MRSTVHSSINECAVRQRGERADRMVAIGAFIAFLATGFVVEDPPSPRDAGGAGQAVRHAAASVQR